MPRTVFVHIGDVHLQAGHPRNADRLASLDQIVAGNVGRKGLGAWLIPGDLFHQKSTAQDRNDLAIRLLAMAAVAPVVLVRGNHDAPGDLDIFAKLKAAFPILVVTRPGVYDVLTATGERAAIAAVPYPEKAGLVALNVAPGVISQTAAELLDIIFMQLAGELARARVGGAIPLFAGHFNVRGSIASTGQPQIGQEQEIDRLSLERLGVVYCALSHIHEPQEVGRGVYAGSIAAMDYGETTRRSYVLVTAERQADGAWTASWTREALDTPPMFNIEGTLTKDGFEPAIPDALMCPNCEGAGTYDNDPEGDCRVCCSTGARRWTACDVRVRYHYQASERAVINEAHIRDLFPGVLRLKIEGVAIPDRELRAPEVAAAKTLPDKLAAFLKVQTLPTSVAGKLALLEQKDREALLVDVAGAIAAIEMPEKESVAA